VDPRRPSRQAGPGSAPGQPATAPAPPAAAARRGPAFSEALDQLARDVRQLQIDFERFFNGGLPFPPDELRGRIQAQLRSLRNVNLTSAADSFRLGDLEARFNSYNEMYNRRLRDLEEGRHHHRVIAFVEKPRFDARGGIVIGSEIDPEAAEALYHGLASGPGEGPRFDLDSFQTYLRRQAESIRQKTGCAEVQFRVAEEDGKLKLKARPVPARQGA
jgi:hypothetical protein